MSFIELILIAVGLSMDAFAVSLCKGVSVCKTGIKECVTVGLWFGIFQALMPTLGYLFGSRFSNYVQSVDHVVALILLSLIGINMIWSAVRHEENEQSGALSFGVMLMSSLATSIDALAVGVTFAFLNVNIVFAVAVIGITTCVLSSVGVKIGGIFGERYKNKAELVGGVILILIGAKIFLQHTFS